MKLRDIDTRKYTKILSSTEEGDRCSENGSMQDALEAYSTSISTAKLLVEDNEVGKTNHFYQFICKVYKSKVNILKDLIMYEEAVAALNEIEKLLMSWQSLGKELSALQEYKAEIIEIWVSACIDCGREFYDVHHYEKALVKFDAAIQIDATKAIAYINKAKTLNALNRYDLAITAADAAIGCNHTPKEEEEANDIKSITLSNQGMALYEAGDQAAAAEIQEKEMKMLLLEAMGDGNTSAVGMLLGDAQAHQSDESKTLAGEE